MTVPVSPPPLEPESPRSSSAGIRWEGLVVLLAVVLGAAATIGGLLWWESSRDGDVAVQADPDSDGTESDPAASDEAASDETASDETAPDETAPDETESPGPEPGQPEPEWVNAPCPSDLPSEVQAVVCELAAFVEDFRGRPFKEFPNVEFADDVEFEVRLLSDFDDDAEELAVTGDVFRSLGLMDDDADLVDALRRSLEVGVVGFYRTDTKELVIRGTDLDLYAQDVIVHELVHAHDDQWLDLDRPELDEVSDESDFGFTAMVEGNAVRVEDAWIAELSAEEREELSRLEQNFFDPEDLDILFAIPTIVLQLQYSPYTDGPVLVNRIFEEAGGGAAGEEAVNQAIIDPPAWSEEVLHPELFPDGDPTMLVPTPPSPEGATVIDEGVVGELVFDLWLGDSIGDGWGGDRYVTWREGGSGGDSVCTAVHVVADSDDDLEEFFDGAEAWVRSDDDNRRAESIDVDGRQGVLIEGCV